MSELQLMQRLLASESRIDAQRIRLGDIKDDEWAAYTQAAEAIAKLPIHIYDNVGLTPQSMRSIAIRHAAKFGLDGIVIDYLQLMDTDTKSRGNRTQDVSDISRACKKLARELNIPVLALSSLSRQCESRADKRPMMSDLRESGSIESDADSVVFIYRDDVYNPDTEFPNIAEIIVSKHRSAPTGLFSVYFKKHLIEFLDLEIRHQPLEYAV
jgi:replicative DNA helicase